jgi:hypothetical protein
VLVLGILLPDGVDKALAHVGSDGDFPWVAPLLLCLFKSGDLLSNRQRLVRISTRTLPFRLTEGILPEPNRPNSLQGLVL